MKIEDRILKLEEVFGVISHTKTFELIIGLKDSRENLISIKNFTKIKMANDILCGDDTSEGVEILTTIELQLKYIDTNIRVLENALLCYETKIFEKRTFMDMKFTLGLN